MYTKDDAYRTLGEINGWIKNADTKASILIGLLTVLIGFIFTIFDKNNISNESVTRVFTYIILLIFLLLSLLSFIFCILTLIARVGINKYRQKNNLPNKSCFFYKSIQKVGYQEFCKVTSNINDDELLNDLKAQIVINSYIANKKYNFFNKALISTIVLFVVLICLFLCFI